MGKVLGMLASCLLLAHEVILQGTARQQGVTTPYNNIQDKNASLNAPSEQDNLIQLVSSAPISVKAGFANDQNFNFSTAEVSGSQASSSTIPPIMTSTLGYPTITGQGSSHDSTFSQSTDTPTTPIPTTTVPPTTQQTTSVPSSTTTFTSRLPPIPTTKGTISAPKTTFTYSTMSPNFASSTMSSIFVPKSIPVITTETTPSTTHRPPNRHNLEIRSGAVGNNRLQRCPRPEDIHPCECVEVATPSGPEVTGYKSEYEVETVAFCKNIRNVDVLGEALKGMQGRHMTYLVLDSVHLPPFPNNLLKNVGVGWMEVLNSTMQFTQEFFQCYEQGCP